MKAEVDLIIFDFDGTLVDSKDDIAASANHVLSVRGLETMDVDVIAGFIGNGIHVLLSRVLETNDEEDIERAVEVFRKHYWEHCLDVSRDYPGVRETLEHLSGITKAVVTNKPKKFTDRMLGGLDLARYFVDVIGGEGPYAKKPSPEGFLAMIERLGASAGRALVVGDSPNDIIGGRAAGCITCAVTYGLVAGDVLAAHSPDITIHSMVELIEMVV